MKFYKHFLLFLLLGTFLSFSLSCSTLQQSSSDETYRFISYNIRYNNPDDGENAWTKRKQDFIQKVAEYSPDILGVQEALHDQILDLKSGLRDYSVVGNGRDDGLMEGEYCGIFFRNSVFVELDSGQFWLSPEPDVIGSVGWDASLTRIATWVILKSLNDGAEFFVLNGHFDHRGSEARTESAKLIVQKTAELAGGREAVILGDFNASPESDAYVHFVDSKEVFDLEDTYSTCRDRIGSVGTFQGFAKRDDSMRRIDYIFTSPGISCQQYAVPADLISDTRYYSDHLPVIVDINYKSEN